MISLVLMFHFQSRTVCLLLCALGLIFAQPDPGLSREKDLPGLQTMAGQMIMCGFRGLHLSVDVNTNPDNPAIGRLERSFSAHPDQVAEQAAAFIQGQHESNILTCIKHFPGHGSAFNDSHLGLTDITQTWEQAELIPYQRLTQSQRCDTIMTGHLVHREVDPNHPASLSRAWTRDVLRRDLGFDGVIITDDLQMRAITDHYSLEQTVHLALEAGADIILFGNNLRYDPQIAARANALIVDLVQKGKVSRQRIQSSYKRITRLKQKLSSHL